MAKRTSSVRKRKSRRPAPQRPRRKTRKVSARRATAKTRGRKARRKARKPAARPVRRSGNARPKQKMPVRAAAAKRQAAHVSRPPTLQRERRVLSDAERTIGPAADSRLIAEAKSGHDSIVRHLREHTESSPALTAGDVDAKWDDAYSVGDEAPGGDNPTPDQNEVDAIGRALGTEYRDDEELLGGEEIEKRDEHRWELDPDSKDKEDE